VGLRTARLASDAMLRVVDLLDECQRESLAQHVEFTSRKLRKTFSRWDVSTQQDLRQREGGFSSPSAAKSRRTDTPCY
jgi:hypothetical protein